MCLKGGPKNRKMSPNTKTVNCHSLTGDEWTPCHQYLSFLVLNLRRYLFTNYTGCRSIQWVRGRGGWKFAKFVTLVQFYKLSMFPCFIVSDANYDSITCNSSSLLWPLPRFNEDPDCGNPRGFRIVTYKWHLAYRVLCYQTTSVTHLLSDIFLIISIKKSYYLSVSFPLLQLLQYRRLHILLLLSDFFLRLHLGPGSH